MHSAALKVCTTIELGRWPPRETWRVPRGFSFPRCTRMASSDLLIATLHARTFKPNVAGEAGDSP